ILGGIAAVMPIVGSLALFASAPWLGPWLAERGAAGVALYVAGFVLLAGFALLPTYAQAGLAGFAFGVAWGVPAALLGFTGASFLGYAIARRVAGDRLAEATDAEPRLAALRHALLQGSFVRVLGMVTLLRLPPNSPFALTNLAFAGLKVPLPAFIVGTVLGMTPRTVVAVVLGASIEQFDKDNLGNNTALLIGLVVTVLVVVIITVMARRVLDRVSPPEESAAESHE
ncbi:MAG: VTT domain-containing protein, partial [Planctomycetota bacterium]